MERSAAVLRNLTNKGNWLPKRSKFCRPTSAGLTRLGHESELINEPVQWHAVKVPTDYLTFVVRKGGNFPTFAHSVVVVELFEFNDVATAPKRRFKNVSKPKRRQIDVR